MAAFALTVAAQDVYLDHWRALRGAQPARLHLEMSTPRTEYYLGEAIPLELRYWADSGTDFSADSRLQDRIGRLNGVESFEADPAADVEDPLAGQVFGAGGMGGLSGGPIRLSRKPFQFPRMLNDWVRFRKPGTFRIYVTGQRVPGVKAVSNLVTLNIRPAPPAWVRKQLATGDADALRYLDTPEAALALANQLGPGNSVQEFQAHLGILASRHRTQVLPHLEARLVAPEQPVWPRYLDTLQRLESLVRPGRKTDYAARLQASIPNKRGAARAECLRTLVLLRRPVPAAWLAQSFRQLEEQDQYALLTNQWSLLRSPAFLPILRELYALPHGPLPSVALRRLHDLSPAEARLLVLAQLRKPDKPLEWEPLSMLAGETLPELDDALAARAEAGDLDDRPIVRYATGAILGRVMHVYEARSSRPGCSLLLPFYFLKYNPSFGETELRRLLRNPACQDLAHQLREVGAHGMSPRLEQIAISLLESPLVPVKRGAAETLGRYGSAAARQPLWATFTYFRNWWNGKEGQMGLDGVEFERTLRVALAQGSAWVLDRGGYEQMGRLCSTDGCRQEVRQWAAEAEAPVRIVILPWGDGEAFELGPYRGRGEAALERRLRLYPGKTAFRIDANSAPQATATITQLLQRTGHLLAP